MAKWGGVDFDELKKFTETLQKTADKSEEIAIACLKEIAARLLAKVIKRTPTGKYKGVVEFTANIPERKVKFTTKAGKNVEFTAKAQQKKVSFKPKKGVGKKGGTLRRGWTANKLDVAKNGSAYTIVIKNDVPYAVYVENGHRTANKKGWVEGQFMLRISENELRTQAPAILEKKMEAMLREAMENG